MAKSIVHLLAVAAVMPALLSFHVRSALFGANRAMEGSSQAFSMIPGMTGEYLRRAFLTMTLAHCARSVEVHFGTLFSQTGARLDERVYVGPRCHLGLVHLEADVLLAAGVHVPSGPATHGTSRLDLPIREQSGTRTVVRIGRGTWVGSAATILADVGQHCVIAAGAVVTRPIPDYSVAAGVPARVIRNRQSTEQFDG